MITNKAGLPAAIVRAVENDAHTPSGADISCTALIGPPMIRHLRKVHKDEIWEDVADRIWALVGQAVHSIIERAATADEFKEEQLIEKFGDRTLVGRFDLFDGETLTDMKVTSVWSAKAGVKPEWKAQLNVLAELLRRNGFEAQKLQVVAILRDWRKNEAQRYGGDYPQQQVVALPVPLWSPEKAQGYIEDRLRIHFDAPPQVCTAEERWDKPTTYAVMAKGRKSAHRLLPTREEAEEWMRNGKGDHVEVRIGTSTRCEQYCNVAQWCPRGRDLLK